MSYLIFARKYRPQTFDEVVGQDHVVKTLKQAIAGDRVAQSFLFTGSRGVGKTSMARILAKALNCEKGPTAKPCGTCTACTEITSGSSLDTLEIDGASNRGIDEIRSLREQVRFKPSSGRYKVYIIDEVHMLTQEAFNALLKTLEEPPSHVKFVFATTEPAKVPVTILSRCQRFHFKPIPLRLIKNKLAEIVDVEKLKAADDVLFLLARAAEGSLRDGESLLDQLASFSKGKLTPETALEAFGLTDEETVVSSLDDLAGHDAARLLTRLDRLIEEGKDIARFVGELADAIRHLLVFRNVKAPEALIEASDTFFDALKERRDRFESADLMFMLDVLTKTLADLRRAESPRLIVELALVRLSARESLTTLSDILAELKGTPAASPARNAGGHRTPARTASSGASTKAAGRTAQAPAAPGRTARAHAVSKSEIRAAIYESPESADSSFADTVRPQAGEYAKSIAGKTATAVLERESAPVLDDQEGASAQTGEATDEPLSFERVETLWSTVVERVKSEKISTGNYLAEAEPLDAEGSVITLGMEEELSFHMEALKRREHSDVILSVCRKIFGPRVSVKYAATKANRRTEEVKEDIGSAPLPKIVESAAEMFGGRVIRKKSR